MVANRWRFDVNIISSIAYMIFAFVSGVLTWAKPFS